MYVGTTVSIIVEASTSDVSCGVVGTSETTDVRRADVVDLKDAEGRNLVEDGLVDRGIDDVTKVDVAIL